MHKHWPLKVPFAYFHFCLFIYFLSPSHACWSWTIEMSIQLNVRHVIRNHIPSLLLPHLLRSDKIGVCHWDYVLLSAPTANYDISPGIHGLKKLRRRQRKNWRKSKIFFRSLVYYRRWPLNLFLDWQQMILFCSNSEWYSVLYIVQQRCSIVIREWPNYH